MQVIHHFDTLHRYGVRLGGCSQGLSEILRLSAAGSTCGPKQGLELAGLTCQSG